MIWATFGAVWQLDEKVSFDGPNKQIRVNSDATNIDVKTDLYSAWKRWMQIDDHAKYPPAFRTIGGDPVGSGQTAGDIYFLINNWQIIVEQPIQVTGVLYHDNPIPVYIITGGGSVTSTVSGLVQNLGFSGTINNVVEPNILPKDVWDYLVSEANTPGSVGERFKSLLTVAKYLGLK
jgi:hypothetical protein